MTTETALPVLSRDELRELVREVLDERQELVGLPAASPDDRGELKQDALFVRRLRKAMDGAASKIGYAVILGIATIIGGLIATGFSTKIGH